MPTTVSRSFAGTGSTIRHALEAADTLCTSYLNTPIYKEIISTSSSACVDDNGNEDSYFVYIITVIVREHQPSLPWVTTSPYAKDGV